MTTDTDDLEAAARALCHMSGDMACMWCSEKHKGLGLAPKRCREANEEKARACALSLPLLRDAMELIDDAYLDAGAVEWHNRSRALLARWRKLVEG